jgi:hypothetical protein
MGYAFLHFEFPADAEEAVQAMNQCSFGGKRLTVEFSKGSKGGAVISGTCLICNQEGHWARQLIIYSNALENVRKARKRVWMYAQENVLNVGSLVIWPNSAG